MTDALLEVVPTLRFGRERKLHRTKIDIVGLRVVLFTVCGLDSTDRELEATHGIPTCQDCEVAK